jgi:hypothetical protein
MMALAQSNSFARKCKMLCLTISSILSIRIPSLRSSDERNDDFMEALITTIPLKLFPHVTISFDRQEPDFHRRFHLLNDLNSVMRFMYGRADQVDEINILLPHLAWGKYSYETKLDKAFFRVTLDCAA